MPHTSLIIIWAGRRSLGLCGSARRENRGLNEYRETKTTQAGLELVRGEIASLEEYFPAEERKLAPMEQNVVAADGESRSRAVVEGFGQRLASLKAEEHKLELELHRRVKELPSKAPS